jgi:hypothetical protein
MQVDNAVLFIWMQRAEQEEIVTGTCPERAVEIESISIAKCGRIMWFCD